VKEIHRVQGFTIQRYAMSLRSTILHATATATATTTASAAAAATAAAAAAADPAARTSRK
jgi:hypothetical protein